MQLVKERTELWEAVLESIDKVTPTVYVGRSSKEVLGPGEDFPLFFKLTECTYLVSDFYESQIKWFWVSEGGSQSTWRHR